MRFLIKFPTRARPDLFLATLDRYYALRSRAHEVEVVVTIDEDDATMNNAAMRAELATRERLVLCAGQHKGKIDAVNADLAGRDFDVLLLASDDMVPEVEGYDDVIARDMQGRFPDLDGCLQYADGFQTSDLYTQPILGKRLYDRFGYIYHPSYRSEWCDNEMTEVTRALGKQARFDRVLIRHLWVGVHHADDLHRRNAVHYAQDRNNYESRRSRGFPPEIHMHERRLRIAQERYFEYHRVGHDSRRIELREDGTIGEGAARLELFWDVEENAEGVLLAIRGESGTICRLSEDASGVWRGRWLRFEEMPIELLPASRPPAPEPAPPATASATSYSQNDEQRHIVEFLHGSTGRFLDVGAHDGQTFSNTRRLVELGWKGTFVEPSPMAFQRLMALYQHSPEMNLVHVAVSDRLGISVFYDSRGEMVSSTEATHRDKWERGSDVRFQEIHVATAAISDLLRSFPGPYEFINLDVESTNWKVLQSLPLLELGTRLLCVEYDDHLDDIERHCAALGFRRLHRTGENVLLGR